jgi:class 3 adenylate cyclase
MGTTRRLAAILAADVVGFSALMERDEEGTYTRIGSLRRGWRERGASWSIVAAGRYLTFLQF